MTRTTLQQRGYRQWPDTLRRDSILWHKRIVDEGENYRAYMDIHETTAWPYDDMKPRYTWDAELYIERPDGLAMKVDWYSIPTDAFDEEMLAKLEAEAVEIWRKYAGKEAR